MFYNILVSIGGVIFQDIFRFTLFFGHNVPHSFQFGDCSFPFLFFLITFIVHLCLCPRVSTDEHALLPGEALSMHVVLF